jgi:hypothetical protein
MSVVNAVSRQNQAFAKKMKTYLFERIGENPKMVLITVNSMGISLVPSRNQWLATLKCHITKLMVLIKPIDCQLVELLQHVKEDLKKQFEYISPGSSLEHMRVIARRFLK